MPLPDGFEPQHGVYLIEFYSVREEQKHNNHLFRTNNRNIAQAWANMHAFKVSDTRSCYLNEILPDDWHNRSV